MIDISTLRVGDVVRLRHRDWGEGADIVGAAHRFKGTDTGSRPLYVGGWSLDSLLTPPWEIEVVSRAPRFYVNADRDVAVGDVAYTWTTYHEYGPGVGPYFYTNRGWLNRNGVQIFADMPATGNILVHDGVTGKAVPEPEPAQIEEYRPDRPQALIDQRPYIDFVTRRSTRP